MSTVVLATGGTGGHIYPAVAVARELLARGHRAALMGQAGGMEERIAAEQGLEFHGVSAGKLVRPGQGRFSPGEVARAGRGLLEARGLLKRLRPEVVVGFGGFASLPGVLAAQHLGISTVLHEQNARLGLTQRLAARRARVVGTAYPEVAGLPPERARMVGMPVREERLERAEALAQLGLQDGPLTVFVMGGSQGSVALNGAVPLALRAAFGEEGIRGEQSIQVLHSTGPRWLSEVAPGVRDLPWYHASGYVDSIAAWSVADLAVTRAGTGTIAEAAFHGVPLVMVPLPESAEGHQLANARAVEAAGAGVVVEQPRMAEDLARAVLECLAADRRHAMEQAALARSSSGAAASLADLIEAQMPSFHAHD